MAYSLLSSIRCSCLDGPNRDTNMTHRAQQPDRDKKYQISPNLKIDVTGSPFGIDILKVKSKKNNLKGNLSSEWVKIIKI